MGDSLPTCHLTGNTGWLLQILLGAMAFTVLIYKRQTETPRRSWKIWFFDSSKQGFVAMEIHFINVGLARAMMESGDGHDSCTWYFTMVVLDSTLGLLTVYWLLRWSSHCVNKYRLKLLYSGEYGTPPRFKPYLAQMLLYNGVMLLEKLLVSLVLLIPFVQQAGQAILRPIGRASATFELVVALLITPFVINVLWFWIVDNFLKKAEVFNVRGSQDRKMSGSPQHPASNSAFEMFDRLLDDNEESSGDDDVIIQRASGASPGHGTHARIRHDSDRAPSQ